MAVTEILLPGERAAVFLTSDEIEQAARRLRRIAMLLDSAVGIPGTRFRIGADSLLGLIPGIGDAAALGLSAWIIAEAHRLGAPRSTLFAMARNAAVDAALGLVPVLGDVADVFFKANLRNIALLERHLAGLKAETARVVNPSTVHGRTMR